MKEKIDKNLKEIISLLDELLDDELLDTLEEDVGEEIMRLGKGIIRNEMDALLAYKKSGGKKPDLINILTTLYVMWANAQRILPSRKGNPLKYEK